jgi:hypothetical protein
MISTSTVRYTVNFRSWSADLVAVAPVIDRQPPWPSDLHAMPPSSANATKCGRRHPPIPLNSGSTFSCRFFRSGHLKSSVEPTRASAKIALRREFFAAKTIDKSSDLAVVFTVVSRSWKVLVGPKNLQEGAACSLDAIAPRRGGGSSGTLPNKSGPSTPSMLGPMEVSLVIWEHHRI